MAVGNWEGIVEAWKIGWNAGLKKGDKLGGATISFASRVKRTGGREIIAGVLDFLEESRQADIAYEAEISLKFKELNK